ncbi:DUF4157 domain-containing protein [Streptomyces sp. NPDC001530]|uniref:eCIS core domain-containing protein n=1 Tax=Streptomyces sp. NPDC001530 TaxID=3364582 RepID=UPI0036786776
MEHRGADRVRTLKQPRRTGDRAADESIGRTPHLAHTAISGGGRPLEAHTRSHMESHFGHDFTQVRVHTDERAAAAARALHATAYTVGPDIAFAAGTYRPETPGGRRLIAHELAHVIQQRNARTVGAGIRVTTTDDPAEREARGRETGRPVALSAVSELLVCRQDAGIRDAGPPGARTGTSAEEIAQGIERLLSTPSEVAGTGDFPAAFRELAALPEEQLMDVLHGLWKSAQLSPLLEAMGAAPANESPRLEAALRVSLLMYGPADQFTPEQYQQTADALDRTSPSLREHLLDMMLSVRTGVTMAVAAEGLATLMSMSAPELNPGLAGVRGAVAPGPWAPPGKQPIPFYIGMAAHIGIAAEYRLQHPTDVVQTNFTPMDNLFRQLALMGHRPTPGRLTPEDIGLMPDIANLTRLHLYEIKPLSLAALARREAQMYRGLFIAGGIPMTLGPQGEPGTFGAVPAPGGVYLFESTEPGVILYQYRKAQVQPVPETVREGRRFRLPKFELRPLPATVVPATAGTLMIIMMIMAMLVLA